MEIAASHVIQTILFPITLGENVADEAIERLVQNDALCQEAREAEPPIILNEFQNGTNQTRKNMLK